MHHYALARCDSSQRRCAIAGSAIKRSGRLMLDKLLVSTVMAQLNHLSFLVEPLGPGEPEALAVIPLIDFTPLTRLIEEFERKRAFDKIGGYAGIVPLHYRFGP